VQAAAELASGDSGRRWANWSVHALTLVVALLLVTLGRAAVECRSQLQLGLAAERAGDLDTARLRWGEALLWRIPIVTAAWADEATRHLRALPDGPRASLAGGFSAQPATKGPATQFGRVPSAPLSLLGGLGLVAALLAAAGWARTARRGLAVITVVGGIIATIALWTA
jgi:hypothetical protein